ncbi:AAA family ATPase [Agromyces sp. NPDC055658]
MRLTRIEFKGYKRLQSAQCNVDGRTIAFIGPNEAGKSSVLQGLSWLSTPNGVLPAAYLNRGSAPGEKDAVVRAVFRVETSDIAAIEKLDIDAAEKISLNLVPEFRVSKTANGTLRTGLANTLTRRSAPFDRALATTRSTLSFFQRRPESVDDQAMLNSVVAMLDRIETELQSTSPWTDERVDQLEVAFVTIRDWHNSSGTSVLNMKQASQKLASTIHAVGIALVAARKPDPSAAIRQLLLRNMPQFILFGDEDRILEPEYNLADPTLLSQPPAPLVNALRVAGSTPHAVWDVVQSGDVSSLRTLERKLNEHLRSRVEPAWTQSRLTLETVINRNGMLEFNINELDSPDLIVTPIAERSDGLRAFLALVCFLLAADLETPPILMIDEAERNLHYDAQADLVRVLTNDLQVSKVLYTTHSPGCLPLDLGTNIRVVQPDRADRTRSTLENNFWTDAEPGFSRLLFAMGAEVAAFSAFRRAVLAEGVSEMVLLPTLLRNATGGRELDFQVAFGLSNMSAPTALGSVALITTFLVDGDASGDVKRRQLLSEGVPKTHILQLPRSKAIEDLVDRNAYLDAVDEWLSEMGKARIVRSSLSASSSIARAVDDYCKDHLAMPRGASHKIICIKLAARGASLPLSASGRRTLQALRKKIEDALAAPYTLARSEGTPDR